VNHQTQIITLDVDADEVLKRPGRAARLWAATERVLERIGDRLTPLLVKETRQARKSRQFLRTFGLLLLCGWGWSVLGVAMVGPGVARGSHGEQMFYGYFVILAIPLLVVVPFGAFRSLAAEQETRTFELLSITAMDARQIVAGKLGSALLQMSIYLSGISPCLAFTYLLRGIDLLTILYFLFWTSMGSLAATSIALLLATLSVNRQFQVLSTIAAVLGTAMGAWIGVLLGFVFFDEGGGSMFRDWEFWVVNAGILTAVAAYFVMVCEAAAARLSFASDNRSTRLRVVMLIQFALWAAWLAVPWALEGYDDPEAIVILAIPAGVHWYVMGALMIGESPHLSQRVKRQLPQSFLGRVFLSWFYPGPGTGYALAVTGLAGTLVLAMVGLSTTAPGRRAWGPWGTNFTEMIVTFCVLGFCYVVFYLGLGLLLMRAIRRVAHVGLLMSVLLQIALIAAGCLVPLVIQLTSPILRDWGYSLLHVTDPFWTLVEVIDGRSLPPQTPVLLVILPLAALAVFALNLPGLGRELQSVRIAKPERVAREDAERAARLHPAAGPLPKNPWDH